MRLSKTSRFLRFAALIAYWFWLTAELLVSDPWVLLGQKLAENPPVQTHNMWVSFSIHFGAFSILGCLLTWATEKWSRSAIRSWFAFTLVYCGATEFLQLWVPRRWPSVGDTVCNMAGILVGLWVFHKFAGRIYAPHPQAQIPDSVPETVRKAA